MYAPVRAGTRGGQGDFKWEDVKNDVDRENYLGHSVLAPKGRWQNGRDVTWYLKDKTDEDARAEEIRLIKEAEEDALAVALGFTPTPRAPAGASRSGASPGALDPNAAVLEKAAKDARRREKEERKVARAMLSYGCEQCTKTFAKLELLKRHLRSHSDEKPYVCTVLECQRSFARGDALLRHMRTRHKDLIQVEGEGSKKRSRRTIAPKAPPIPTPPPVTSNHGSDTMSNYSRSSRGSAGPPSSSTIPTQPSPPSHSTNQPVQQRQVRRPREYREHKGPTPTSPQWESVLDAAFPTPSLSHSEHSYSPLPLPQSYCPIPTHQPYPSPSPAPFLPSHSSTPYPTHANSAQRAWTYPPLPAPPPPPPTHQSNLAQEWAQHPAEYQWASTHAPPQEPIPRAHNFDRRMQPGQYGGRWPGDDPAAGRQQ